MTTEKTKEGMGAQGMGVKWKIDYDNDTGPNDDYFHEWWVVTDGARSFKCGSSDDAEWLRAALSTIRSTP